MIPDAVAPPPPAAVVQAGTRMFAIPSGPAPDAILTLAAQADIDVVVAVDLRGRRSSGLQGRMTTPAALDRLLTPLGARARAVGPGAWRIEARPAPTPSHPRRSPAPAQSPVDPVELSDVVVTAPARRGALEGASGRSLLDPSALERAAAGEPGAQGVADLTSSVESTRQGPGRNKLFVRGVADSAFNGPLQATVGQYLGDLRLTYGSPDPDLRLIDVRRIEIFEGPQSARFASGSIGGVVRIEPRPPDLAQAGGSLVIGGSWTRGGDPGGDLAVVVNQPLGAETAVRALAYVDRDGGVIDNPVLGRRRIDEVQTSGARTMLRTRSGPWAIDAVLLGQRISAADAPTVSLRHAGEKTRRISEPYVSELGLAGLTASRGFGGARLTWATSLSWQALDERFDATQPRRPDAAWVDRGQSVRALSSEVRIETDPAEGWWWSGGLSAAHGETRSVQTRWEDGGSAPQQRLDLSRRFTEAVLFGEAVTRPAARWQVALGGRLAISDARHGVAVAAPKALESLQDGTDVFLAPSLGVVWTRPQGAQAFARLEQGVRPGSVSEAGDRLERFRADRVTLFELGWRTPVRPGAPRGEFSLGWLDWRDIQSDVASQGGELTTANIGDGDIQFVHVRLAWEPTDQLVVSGSFFLNQARVKLDGFNTIGVSGGDIPGVARAGAQVSAQYELPAPGGSTLRLGADLRYVGRSRPGLGPGLDVDQGDYVNADLYARLGDDRRAISLQISNPLDVGAIRYGVGSPYQLFEPQGVPLRPLEIRLGFEASF